MSICNRCERIFVYKNSLRRHQQKRRNPCRPAVASCAQCGNTFTCFESLKKHKKLYCKAEQHHHTEIDIQDFLNQLPSANASLPSPPPPPPCNNHNDDDDQHQLHTPQSVAEFTRVPNTYFHNDSLQELLNQINFSPLMSNSNNINIEKEEEEECKANTVAADDDAITVYDDDDDDNSIIVNVDNDRQ